MVAFLDQYRPPQSPYQAFSDQEQDEQEPEGYSGVDDSLPDYRIHLQPEELFRLGRRIAEEIRRYEIAIQPRMAMLAEWRASYEMVPTGRAERWERSADIPSSLTRIYCQAASTRLNQQIVQAKPPMAAVARSESAIEAAPYAEDAMEYVLDQAEWPVSADEVHTELPIAGAVFVRTTYEHEVIHVPTEHVRLDDDMARAHVAAGADPNAALWDNVETTEHGRAKRHIQFEDRTSYTGVKFKVIPFEDGIIMPPTIRRPEQAYGIGERTIIRGEELLAGAKMGRYIESAVEELIRKQSDNTSVHTLGYYNRYERQTQQGLQPDAAAAYASSDQGDEWDGIYHEYNCYELCWKGDWNDDGKLEWALVTIHEPTQKILGIQYLPYEHGEPCYTMMGFLPRVGELFPCGLAELIAAYQDADTAVWCALIDHADLALNWNGNFFYQKSANYDPDKVVVGMGRGIPVDDINGVKELPVQPLPAEIFQLHQTIKDRMDLVTASSNPSLGQVTDAKKTLGEVQIVAASANMMFEEMAARVARQWKSGPWNQARWLVAQYGDGSGDGMSITYRKAAVPGRKIVVQNQETGEQQEVPVARIGGQEQPAPNGVVFKTIDSSILREDIDFIPTALGLLSDMQSKLGQATQVMNLLLNHPLAQGNVEVQRLALEVYLQAFHFPMAEKIMAAIEEGIQQQQAAAAQQQQVQGQLEAALGPAAQLAVQKALLQMLEADAKAAIGQGGQQQTSGPPPSAPGPVAGPGGTGGGTPAVGAPPSGPPQ